MSYDCARSGGRRLTGFTCDNIICSGEDTFSSHCDVVELRGKPVVNGKAKSCVKMVPVLRLSLVLAVLYACTDAYLPRFFLGRLREGFVRPPGMVNIFFNKKKSDVQSFDLT